MYYHHLGVVDAREDVRFGNIEAERTHASDVLLRNHLDSHSACYKHVVVTEGLDVTVVHVKMRQADMPAGLSNLLHLAANNMSIQEAAPKRTSTRSLQLAALCVHHAVWCSI